MSESVDVEAEIAGIKCRVISTPLPDRSAQTAGVPMEIKGASPALKQVLAKLLLVARTPTLPVLLTGETGTGKELAARTIHSHSRRAAGPFVAVNCASLSETLLEAELFGYASGAFTGARAEGKVGLFEAAKGGTIFLDEVGDASLPVQRALLRVLEQRTIRRVGDVVERPIDVRVIAASNRDLPQAAAADTFRHDLFYRLSVVTIRMPPLRERPEDIPLLAAHFLEQATAEVGIEIKLSTGAMGALKAHDWPGNVRELKNAVLRGAALASGAAIEADDLDLARRCPASAPASAPAVVCCRLVDAERALILQALEVARGNKSDAAKILGINRSSLYSKLRAHGLETR